MISFRLSLKASAFIPLSSQVIVLPASNKIGLRQWIWRAFVQSALIPLILVETVLIAIYLLTNTAIRDAQIEHLRETALVELQSAASQESRVIDERLNQVGMLTELYRNLTAEALLDDSPVAPATLAITESGVRYTPEDNGRAASFYANSTPPERQDLEKVSRLTRLDPLMKEIEAGNPLVASLYFNSWDSYNHIYPWFKTPDQYPHDMIIPDYNFYYLADARHNPARQVVWTEVYLDPAGHGWMMSAIAPVYRADFLEGVVGIDITVDGILRQISALQVPWEGYALLVSDDLDIMALPAQGESDFVLNELTTHSYEEAIRQEMFKPEDFNLAKRPATAELGAAIEASPQGVRAVSLNGRQQLVAWSTIEQTGWHLLTVVDEQALFRQTNALASRYQQIGYLLIAGLVLFYLIFFGFMWLRAKQLSGALRQPIAGVSRMLTEIGQGHWRPERVHSEVAELDDMAGRTATAGQLLEQSETQRSRAHQRLELVMEGATESVWERNLVTQRIELQGRFSQRFGLSSQLGDDEFLARVHPEDVPAIEAVLRNVLRSNTEGGRYEAEYRFADANGRYCWLLSRGRVIERDAATGKAVIVAGTHVDINALKAIQSDLRLATREAEAASAAKTRLISSISHELRTPLNAIHGFAQLMHMERTAAGNSDQRDYLDEILTASRHLGQLVGDIIDWSALQAEKPQLRLAPVGVAALLRECAELVRHDVDKQGVELRLELPGEALTLPADRRRLRQVLLNLLSNAIKYNTPAGRIILGCELTESSARLYVQDTGLGIPDDLQDRLFQPFQRLGRENTSIQGTGIGLSLCDDLARLMNARMGFVSEAGKGSRFWIELPRECAEPAPPVAMSSSLPRVCYVEDDLASQLLVRHALAEIADVRLFDDGTTALAAILAEPPALLLLDLNLPGLNGEEVLRRLRQHPATQSLPVVILSAATNMDMLANLVSLGCQDLINKPIDLAELRGLVNALLHESV